MKINQNQFPSLGIIFIILVAISMVFSSVNLVVADVNAVSNSQDFDGQMMYSEGFLPKFNENIHSYGNLYALSSFDRYVINSLELDESIRFISGLP
tara:strand:- start:1133 stop:1420 length:288 start_codon:yes stop_codon:yes gene_type:complete